MVGTTDVVVRFIGDSTSVQNEVAKVEGTGSKISGWAKGIGGAIAGAFAIKAVTDFIGAASALQDEMSATGEIFGKGAKSVEAFGAAAAENFGMSQREAMAAANTMGTFGKAAGKTDTDLAAFSQTMVGLAGDLASFRGTTPEEAITALGGALRGENEGIRAYGVMLDEATIKARAMSMGLVSATGDVDKIKSAQISATTAQETYNKQVEKFGKDSPEAALALQKMELSQSKLNAATAGSVPELTAQQKILATQAEIIAQTSDAQGDFARTSDSAANQQKALKAQIENAQASIGMALLPVLQKILPILEKFAVFVQANSGWLVPLAGALLAVAAATWVWNSAIVANTVALLANPIGMVVVAVAALVAAVILLWQNWDRVWQWVMDHKAFAYLIAIFFPIIAQLVALVAAAKFVQANWEAVWNAVSGAVGAAVRFIVGVWDTLKFATTAVWQWVSDKWNQIVNAISGAVAAIGSIIRGLIATFDAVKAAATAVWQWVADKFRDLANVISGVVGAISSAAGRVADVIKAPINSVIRAWNNLTFRVPEVDLGPFGKIGGQEWSPPNITPLAKGGIVTAPTLAMIGERGPEAVVPLGRGGNSLANTYNINVTVAPGGDAVQAGRQIVELIRAHERANGRAWRDIA